ncbi:hypothetical protein IAQ61_001083 [Plenodomus lingam]|uniref:uncharacterized protein n=1 Tax=Leptosphaeria maculans TaxID=5022 RepID=UPI00331E7801|nr:hypothetical protein IAQ61_001083 [Plenodomus lingam]
MRRSYGAGFIDFGYLREVFTEIPSIMFLEMKTFSLTMLHMMKIRLCIARPFNSLQRSPQRAGCYVNNSQPRNILSSLDALAV